MAGVPLEQQIIRAKALLATVRHAAMATVNEDGSPHNTPYFFMRSPDLRQLYWGSHPESEHSKNVTRTGQIYIVLYDAFTRGGLFIEADNAHPLEGPALKAALRIHNELRARDGRDALALEYYQAPNPQRMYVAQTRRFWVNASERGTDGHIIRDIRTEVTRQALLA